MDHRAHAWLARTVEAPRENWRRDDRGERQRDPAAEVMGEHSKAGGRVMKYVVIYERGLKNWGAFAPDLPGYAATAPTLEELRRLVREGIPFHVEGLRLAGDPVPPPNAVVDLIESA
jgi:predicted RNase H-like HicB family nuclease